jgi:hypothetical protein
MFFQRASIAAGPQGESLEELRMKNFEAENMLMELNELVEHPNGKGRTNMKGFGWSIETNSSMFSRVKKVTNPDAFSATYWEKLYHCYPYFTVWFRHETLTLFSGAEKDQMLKRRTKKLRECQVRNEVMTYAIASIVILCILFLCVMVYIIRRLW